VPESNVSPHAIDNDSCIYIRTSDTSHPDRLEKLADTKRIEWLWNRRKKSEEFRDEITMESSFRFQEVMNRVKNPFEEPTIHLTCTPLFPFSTLISPQQIDHSFLENLEKQGYGRRLPHGIGVMNKLSIPNGLITNYNTTEYYYYCELNQFGLFSYIESVHKHQIPANTTYPLPFEYIHISEIFSTIDLYFESLAEFYEKLNFFGLIKISAFINLKRKNVLGLISGTNNRDDRYTRNPLDDVHYTRTIEARDFIENRKKITIEALQTISWNIGFANIDCAQIDEYFRLNGRFIAEKD